MIAASSILRLCPIIQEIVVNFPGTKDDPFHIFGRSNLGRAEDFFEPALNEFFRGRGCVLGAQQTFWRRDDERLDESRVSSGVAAHENTVQRSWDCRPGCCLRHIPGGNARGGHWNVPAPGLRIRAAAKGQFRWAVATSIRLKR